MGYQVSILMEEFRHPLEFSVSLEITTCHEQGHTFGTGN